MELLWADGIKFWTTCDMTDVNYCSRKMKYKIEKMRITDVLHRVIMTSSKTINECPTPKANTKLAATKLCCSAEMMTVMTSLDHTHFATCICSLLSFSNALQRSTHLHAQTILKVIVLVLVLFTCMHVTQTILKSLHAHIDSVSVQLAHCISTKICHYQL